MSYWTYISGTIRVSPPGRTQAEKRYILDTILAHLPNVTGSERDMYITVMEAHGCESSSSHDEFQMLTDNLVDRYGQRNRKDGWLRCNEDYLLILEGKLRDREFEQTYKEFVKWLCRLCKRIDVEDILVQIKGHNHSEIITNSYLIHPKHSYNTRFGQMYENPSWCNDTGEPAWWEYLMWDRYGDSSLPLQHVVKYYNCPDADAEWNKKMKLN